MKVIGLLLAASAALALGSDTAKAVSGASYSEKKFYFAAIFIRMSDTITF
jgi:hypothetical protein